MHDPTHQTKNKSWTLKNFVEKKFLFTLFSNFEHSEFCKPKKLELKLHRFSASELKEIYINEIIELLNRPNRVINYQRKYYKFKLNNI